MKKRIICGVLLIAFISLLSVNAYAKTYAWVVSVTENKAQKVDVDNNIIVKTVKILEELDPSAELQEWENAIIADANSNLLFVVYDYPGRYLGQGVKAYNLRDMIFKKDLGVTCKDPQYDLPKLIIPPVGDKLYILWWNSASGKTCSVYSKATLTKINDLTNFPVDIYHPWMFSSDGTKLYSLNIDANEIKVYDGISFALKETISIAAIWGSPLYLKRLIPDTVYLGSSDKIMLMENIKSTKSEPSNIKYFVYDILARVISNKITIVEFGQESLTPDGSKIILSDDIIYIYSFSEANKLKTLDLRNRYKDLRILKNATISPDSSKLYLMGENIQTKIPTLIVIDLKKTYSVVAEIPSIEASRMIFFNE